MKALSLLLSLALPIAVHAAPPDEVASLGWCPGQKDCLEWTAAAGAEGYTLYRGESPDLAALLDASVDSCTAGTFAGTSTGATLAAPQAGSLHWYLVTASNAEGEGTPGAATGGPRAVDSAGACISGTAGLILNEVDYDQPGSDSAEFVEVYNGAAAPRDLTGVALIFVNGQNSQEYRRVELQLAGPSLAAGAYLVVGSSDVVALLPPGTPSVTFASSSNNIQNGAPDGIALFDTATGSLLDALSYEGEITNAELTGFPGTYDLVEGNAASAADSSSINGSLGRFPNGVDTNDADTDWSFNNLPSPGLENPIP